MNAREGKKNPAVDAYLKKAKKWREEMARLRLVLLGRGLIEEVKYGKPCYTFQKSNVVIMVPFKEHCALLFSKGALLKDARRLLIQPTENTQATRQMRFTSVREIVELEAVLESYLTEAVEVERAGLEVVYKQTSEFKVPAEFQGRLDKSPALRHAFEALTPGRQRGYLLHFAAPKQSKTRESRIEKWFQQILAGKGLNDR